MLHRSSYTILVVLIFFAFVSANVKNGQPEQQIRDKRTVTIYICGDVVSHNPCTYEVPSQPKYTVSTYTYVPYKTPYTVYQYPTYYRYYYPYIPVQPQNIQPQIQPIPQGGPASTLQCVGPCINSQCPKGYTCNEYSVCCAPYGSVPAR